MKLFVRSFFTLLVSIGCYGGSPTYPGSSWGVIGNTSPFEKGNTIGTLFFEQGISFSDRSLSVLPYVAVTATYDSHHFEWNDRAVGTVGLKAVARFPNGIVSAALGYAEEARENGMRRGAPVVNASYWFGWQRAARFPGSSWGVAGTISPVERHNVISVGYLEQGIHLATIRGLPVVAFADYTVSHDTEGREWNNRTLVGYGARLVIPHAARVVEVGTAYEYEHRSLSGLSGRSVVVFLKYWTGWNSPENH